MTDAEAATWMINRFIDLGIRLSTHGKFGTIVDNELYVVGDNHVKSLLRRDFLQMNGNHPGLNRMLEGFIMRAKEGGRKWEGDCDAVHAQAWKLPT